MFPMTQESSRRAVISFLSSIKDKEDALAIIVFDIEDEKCAQNDVCDYHNAVDGHKEQVMLSLEASHVEH